ncbi:hypothetical protein BJ138DRAFT_984546, partial [Hygrophoropsis aurantiaca]
YENSWYGPVNMMLTTYFPASQHFMVKPQARLRQPPAPGARTSTDSYRQTVGTSNTDKVPDFLACIGGREPDGDIPFLILEVKKEDAPPGASNAQIMDYTEWVRHY